jgi:hypothetical protein
MLTMGTGSLILITLAFILGSYITYIQIENCENRFFKFILSLQGGFMYSLVVIVFLMILSGDCGLDDNIW